MKKGLTELDEIESGQEGVNPPGQGGFLGGGGAPKQLFLEAPENCPPAPKSPPCPGGIDPLLGY